MLGGCSSASKTIDNSSNLKIKYYRADKTSLPSGEYFYKMMSDTCSALPSLWQKVRPSYFPIAIKAGLQGDVLVRIFVNAEGQVYKAQIMRSDIELFNQDAIDATMQWRFTPYMENCVEKEFVAEVPISFRLSNGRPNVLLP